MKQEIVPQGACLLLFCVVRFSSPLKSYRHLMMYALVNAAGFRFVQMLERLSHPGKKYLVGVQFCRLSFRRLIALLISDTLNHSCRCMMASRPDIPDPQWFHASVAPSRGNVPLWFRQDADLRFYDIDDSLFLTQLLAPCTDLRFQFPDALICRLLWMACPQLSPGDFLPTAQSVSANPKVPDDLCSLRPLLCHRFTEPALNTSSYQGDASPFRPYAVSFHPSLILPTLSYAGFHA